MDYQFCRRSISGNLLHKKINFIIRT